MNPNRLISYFHECKSYTGVDDFEYNVIDRTTNENYNNLDEYIQKKNLHHKKFYYKEGGGIYGLKNITNILKYIDKNSSTSEYAFDMGNNTLCGTSSTTIETIFLNCNKLNIEAIHNIFIKMLDTTDSYEFFNILFDYIELNYKIEDFNTSNMFFYVLGYNIITQKSMVNIYTNFKTVSDMCNCVRGAINIPYITKKNPIYIYNNMICLDCGILSMIYSKKHTLGLDINFTDVELFKEIYDYPMNMIQKLDLINLKGYVHYHINRYFYEIEYIGYE